MKAILVVLTFVLNIFTADGQDLNDIIKGINNGHRLDTLISFGEDEREYLPLTVVKGKDPGITFTLIAGIHGYEYPPIVAVQELMKEIDVNRLNGTLIILPIANIASFYERSLFVNPIDGKNLNTTFPGSPSGSITDRLAHWITKEIIPDSDIFLDIHGGDANEDMLPFICYYNNTGGAAQTEQARLLSEASGIDVIVSYPYNISDTEPAKYAFKQAVQDGIVALSIEAGKLGTVQPENVELIKNAVYNMLDYLEVYKTERHSVAKNKRYFYDQSYIRVPQKGLFFSSVKSGDTVKKNENIGHITDVFGHVIHQIVAPVNGTVLYKVGTPPVNVGETLFCIGH